MKPEYRLPQDFIAESPVMKRIYASFQAAAKSHLSVLLRGETGVGKDRAARVIYDLSGLKGPFVQLHLDTYPEHLRAAQLFGYEKGAYSGAETSFPGKIEQAEGGVLFINEVGDIPFDQQGAIRLFLDTGIKSRISGMERRFNVKIVAATNRNLGELIMQGAFREDLYHRLAGYKICIPPLRERVEDIPGLARSILGEISLKNGRTAEIDADAVEMLQKMHWPGNVRQRFSA